MGLLLVLGVVLVGLGNQDRKWLLAVVAAACLPTSVVVGLAQQSWLPPLLTLGLLVVGGLAANHKLLTRADALVVVWLMAAGGVGGPGLIIQMMGIYLVMALVMAGRDVPQMIKERSREVSMLAVGLLNHIPIEIAPPRHQHRLALWPAALLSVVVGLAVGVPDPSGVTTGQWWLHIPMIWS